MDLKFEVVVFRTTCARLMGFVTALPGLEKLGVAMLADCYQFWLVSEVVAVYMMCKYNPNAEDQEVIY
jgi:hypothetical protein